MPRHTGVTDGIDYHQYYLEAGWPENELGWPDLPTYEVSLVEVLDPPSWFMICTGIANGVLPITIETLDTAPPRMDDTQAWEAVSEASLQATNETVSVNYLQIMAVKQWPPELVDIPLPAGPGCYRVRVHAVGRRRNWDDRPETVEEMEFPERHLIQLWPEPAPREAVVLLDDGC